MCIDYMRVVMTYTVSKNFETTEIKLKWLFDSIYRRVSNIRRTESQHLKDSHTVLRLSLPNPLKPDVKSRMKI